MISPTSLMKQHGRLVPFFKCVCVYFVSLGVGGGAAPSPSGFAVAAKCAPVLALLLVVLMHARSLPSTPDKEPARRYARLVGGGLALSAVGDALLVWERGLLAGMAAFGGAHLAYAAAFGGRRAAGEAGGARAAATAAAAYAACGTYVWALRPPDAMRAPVAAYGALLATMAWRAAASDSGRAALGAALFLASDAALARSLFAAPLPGAQTLVMATYYLGQLCIALSALRV